MAALQEVEAHYKFRGGVSTKEDPKAVPATSLLVLENGVFAEMSSIRKRNGYEALGQSIDSSASTVDGAIRFATRGNELLEFTPNRCYSRQDDDTVNDVGAVFSAVPSDRPLVRTGTQQTMPDHATLSDVTVVAWEDSAGGVWWSTVSAISGRIYRTPTQAASNGRSPRCVPCGSNLHVYYAVPTTERIMVLVVNPASPGSAVTPTVLIDDLDSTQSMYDATRTARSGTPAAIAWFEAGTTAIRLGYVDQSGVLGTLLLGHPSALTFAASRSATSPLGLAFEDNDGSGGDLFGLAWISGGASKAAMFTGGQAGVSAIAQSSTTKTGPAVTSIVRVAIALTNVVAITAWEEDAVSPSNARVIFARIGLGTGSLSSFTVRSVGLVSRAFQNGFSAATSDVFVTVVHDTTFFNTYLVLRMSDGNCVGRLAPAAAGGLPDRQHLASAPYVDSVASIALPFRERLISENDDQFRETGIRLYSLDFDNDASHQSATLGSGLYMAGACPMHYDGRVWTEQGFHFGPELIVLTPAAGGSMTSSTTYEYFVWYEWTDAQGEVHRGPVSIGQLVTMGVADTQVTLTLPTLRVTMKTNVRIMVARSLAAKTGDAERKFRVTSLDPTTAGAVNGYVANSTSVDTVTLIDRLSDVDLALFDELYIDGGVLSNDPVATGAAITVFKGRLLTTDPSDGNTLRFTQFKLDGYGVEFAPELALSVDPFGGDITALAARDDRAFVFKAGAIFTFAGDGPDSTGSSATTGFGQPQLLPGDVGCTNPQSIVLTPNGFLFQSAKGIYQLGNDGSLSYVGAPVERYNSQSIRRATVMPDRTQVVFLTDSGLSLLYDYLFGQWSTFTNHEGRDAAVVNNQYHYLRTDGRVFRETIGQYSDAGTRITLKLETAWLHLLEQLQGFQKVFELSLLGTWISPHQLGIQYQTDYTTHWTDAYWYDATGLSSSTGWITGTNAGTIGAEPIAGSNYGDGEYGDGEYGGTPPGLYEWRLDLYEPCESIQFRFQDFEAEGYEGASFELTELVLTGGAIANVRRPRTAARSA